MKKKMFSILSAGLFSVILLCGFEMPKVEEGPSPSVYTKESLSQAAFETDGMILETSQKVPSFKADIPVRIVDFQGNPIQNAGIVTTTTEVYGKEETVVRKRPYLNSMDHPILTDHEGRASIPYAGSYSETTLFVFTPEILAGCWGKEFTSVNYPICTRIDIPLEPSGNMKETVITITPANPTISNPYTYSAVLRCNGKPAVDYLCTLSKIPLPKSPGKEPERHIPDGGIPPLGYEFLTNVNGKVSFPELEAGTWKIDIYNSKYILNEDGTSNLIHSYTFTLNKQTPQKNTIILLPNQ
jgi:hypothetical protein